MRYQIILFVFLCTFTVIRSEAASIEELVERVRQERVLESQKHEEREKRFKESRDQQQALLEEAKKELGVEERRSENLKVLYELKERDIESKNLILKQRLGALGELHGVVRQIAGDIDVIIDNSLITAQIPDRDDLVDKLAGTRELPEITELEELWHLVLEEIAEAGKVTTFPVKIITNHGDEIEKNVTRVGVFNAVSMGRFLRYLPETGRLVEPARQPAERFQSMAMKVEQSTSGIIPFPVDPTRGVMLALLIQVPDLMTRIKQGGIVGLIIIFIGLAGLLIAAERFVKLNITQKKVNKQLHDESPGDNPLGHIMAVYHSNPDIDTETLGLKLDEAILKEMPDLHRGLVILSLLAAIAPLLGLLGTVTGIIETFQSITLFGTGDPRVMSGGISQALVTTVMGLITAIPLLLLHSFLSSKSNQLVQMLDEKSASYVAMLAEAHGKK